jgi:outer membrane protein W
MKKIVLSTLVLVACSMTVSAKKRPPVKADPKTYVRLGATYDFPLAGGYNFTGTPINGTANEFAGNPEPISFNVKKASYSSGAFLTLAGGYMFTRNIGVDVAVSMGLAMTKYKYKEVSPYSVNDYTVTRTSYAERPLFIMPSLVFSTGGGVLEPYGRLGLAISPGSKIVREDFYTTTGGSQTIVSEIKNKPAIGITGAAGAKYDLGSGFGLWLEVNGLCIAPQASSGEVIEFRANGNSYLSQLTVEQREIEFSTEYTVNSTSAGPGVPTQSGPATAPFNNIGVGLGVSIDF